MSIKEGGENVNERQILLLQKTDRLRGIVNRIGDNLILYNRGNIPEEIKEEYDKLSFNVDSFDAIVCRAKKAEALDWCELVMKGIVLEVNSFNFAIALHNNKSYTEE